MEILNCLEFETGNPYIESQFCPTNAYQTGGKKMRHHNKPSMRIFFISIVFLATGILSAAQTITVGDIKAKPGEKKTGYITVPAGEDGPEVLIPVTVVNGQDDGPVLALIAGIHGYEYPPILALQRLGLRLDPVDIDGAVILVHVANIPSFLKRTIYYNPHDWINLNRAFPGKADGTMCERIAYVITREVIDRCDALVDNHCGDGNEDLIEYLYCADVDDPELYVKTKALAEAFGLRIIVHDTTRPRDPGQSVYCANTALLRGKPAITIESGKLGRTDEEDIDRILTGSYNVMKHLGMIQGKPELIGESVWVKEYTILRSEGNGIFTPLVGRGYHVQRDELIGILTDFFGNTIQEVRAPYNGIVLYIIATPPMSEGEPMASVGRF